MRALQRLRAVLIDAPQSELLSRRIARLGISRSFQVAQIFPSLTVFENMCAAAAAASGSDGGFAHMLAPLQAPATLADADHATATLEREVTRAHAAAEARRSAYQSTSPRPSASPNSCRRDSASAAIRARGKIRGGRT